MNQTSSTFCSTNRPQLTNRILLTCALSLVALLVATPPAKADWPNTNATKWVQYPDPFEGLDVAAYAPLILAEDFLCTNTGPITDIHLWASWQGDNVDPNTIITLGLWTDVPAVVGGPPSHPGQMVWSQVFGPGQYVMLPWMNGQEQFWNPDSGILGADNTIFQYNFYPTPPYVQQGTTAAPTVYWLSVSANQSPLLFGWKTSTNSWGDAAVYGHVTALGDWQKLIDPRTQQTPLSLAFALTTTNTQPTTLPVLPVTQTGATSNQAVMLATNLGILPASLIFSNSEAYFLDPSNFMAVPTTPVTDPAVISNLTAGTENPYPGIPLRFEQINFQSLSNIQVFSEGAAVASFFNALGKSGLTPQSGAPAAGHTSLTSYYSNDDQTIISNRQVLDTQVQYKLTAPSGYPIVGPGAQMQVAFGSDGKATRLLYAARKFSPTPGPSVQLIPPDQATQRAASQYPGLNAQISPRLVYYSPPLSLGTVNTLIPWYQCGGTAPVTNPASGQVSSLDLMPVLIPATDDPAYVPIITLTANTVGSTQVVASVGASGGLPPYTYQWGGSTPGVSSNTEPNIVYTPIVRASPPPLAIRQAAGGTVAISWPDPSPGFNLESNTGLAPAGWAQVATQPQTNNGIKSVMINLSSGPTMFFRLRLAGQTLPASETVTVTVMDADGVSVQASQTIPVQAMPMPATARREGGGPQPQIVGIVDWGTESPFDPGLGTNDRNSWTTGMTVFGGGVQRFCWIDSLSWKQDFQDSPTGINNYEVDNADITLYIGHGNPVVITFTGGPGPNPTTLFFNEATHFWGNLDQEWMCFLSCDVLEFNNASGNVWQRWGPNFDGLHILTGFESLAWAGTGFPIAFSLNMLGFSIIPPSRIVPSWFSAALGHGTGSPAALGPIGPSGVWDYNDYYWGRGPVGPTIRWWQNHGWWYLSNP